MHDSIGDAAPRRTDPGADGPFDPAAHRLIDLWEITVGAWLPSDPQVDLFTGSFDDSGQFLRLDLLMDGLVNPPGNALPWDFTPFAYGPHPVFGFIEVDMDEDVDTGGELELPQYHFLGNVVRFGGKPALARFANRVALDDSAFDGDFLTPPFVERHGEEFHLAFIGGLFADEDIEVVVGNGDLIFEEGETWQISAPWFHRAHGYEPFSLAEGGSHSGEYMPNGVIRLQHDVALDLTLVSFVFPLTNVGAGQMDGQPPQPPNGDPSDQASVLEALIDLRDSALFLRDNPSGDPAEAIILAWADKDPEEYLEPGEWNVTALLGTSYTAADPAGEFFVWTDIYPDVRRGDVDGDDEAEDDDVQLIEQFVAVHDGDDGQVDGRVVLENFATNFSVFDINHNGVVDGLDVLLVSKPGDTDADEDVDLADFAAFQTCFAGSGNPFAPPACGLADLDADGDVDSADYNRFERHMTGPEEDD